MNLYETTIFDAIFDDTRLTFVVVRVSIKKSFFVRNIYNMCVVQNFIFIIAIVSVKSGRMQVKAVNQEF